MGDPLADFNGEGENNHHGKHIDPGNDQHMIFTQELKQREYHKQHHHTDQANDQEMELFVREYRLTGIVPGQDRAVNFGDQAHDGIQQFTHILSSVLKASRQGISV